MELPDFTVEHLKALPLRANVAFAVRCARRVEHLAQLPEDHPERENRRSAVEAALRMAEAYAMGKDATLDESVVAAIDASRCIAGGSPGSMEAAAAVAEAAHAAASSWHAGAQEADEGGQPGRRTAEARKFLGALAHVTADLAALNAFTAAADPFVSVGYHNQSFVDATLCDYDRLVHLKLGRDPEPGSPGAPSPDGPLRPL